MPKLRTTVTIDERVMRAVRVKAARTGRRDSDVIEEALRRDLGFDLLGRIWENAELDENEAMQLAVEAQHEARDDRG
jgi:Ribbon-helix-helix protein, copG family